MNLIAGKDSNTVIIGIDVAKKNYQGVFKDLSGKASWYY